MIDFLSTAGIVEPRCKRLSSKGKSFKTAAFMVSCNVSSRDIFTMRNYSHPAAS